VPATAPVHAFVAELQSLGVNAHGLDLLSGDQGRGHLLQAVADAPETDPSLLVATEASIRGIDLPDLSHVFLLGKPQGRMADSYLHIAGRVGRFGRSGHVITISEEADARRMRILLKEIGITPTKFEHFD
jgi:superfamily II DNA/RNA helicase